MKFLALVLAGVLIFFCLFDILEPNGYGIFGKVKNGNVAILTRFGKAQDEILEPGFHLKGFFDVLNPMSIQAQSEVIPLNAFSRDIQQVDTVVTVNYNIDKNNATTLFKEVGKNYFNILVYPRVQENVKVVFANYTAEELIEKRDELSSAVKELMNEELAGKGITVNSISIEDLDFTDAFTNAVEEKQVASQKKLTAATEQERLTMEAKQEAERQTIASQAAAEQEKIRADAAAYSTKVKAEAEAEANAKISASLTDELINYTKAQSWDGKMPIYMGNGTPILNFDEVVE